MLGQDTLLRVCGIRALLASDIRGVIVSASHSLLSVGWSRANWKGLSRLLARDIDGKMTLEPAMRWVYLFNLNESFKNWPKSDFSLSNKVKCGIPQWNDRSMFLPPCSSYHTPGQYLPVKKMERKTGLMFATLASCARTSYARAYLFLLLYYN